MALSRESTVTLDEWDREAWHKELLSRGRLVEDSNGWTWDLNFFRSYEAFASQVNYKEGISIKQLFNAKEGVSERLILKILN